MKNIVAISLIVLSLATACRCLSLKEEHLCSCPNGKSIIGGYCYDKCPTGFSMFGFDCHQNCLSGWRDQGLFCRTEEYGRGAGYQWRWGDGFSDAGMMKRC